MFRPVLAVLLVLLLALGSTPASHPVGAETLVFQTDMYGTENIPAVTTVSYGFVRFFFNDARTAADYTVDVKGYNGTQVTSADIHRGARGVNGPVVKHLADGGFIVTGGRTTFSQQDLQDMAAGLWYVSLKTVDHPEGALRGQIVLPAGFMPASSPRVEPVAQLPALEAPVETERSGDESLPPVNQPLAPSSVPSSPPPSTDNAPARSIFRPPNTGDGGLLP